MDPAEVDLPRSAHRLAEELDEDGIVLGCSDAVRSLVLAELDFARRIPVFEGRRPLYGSMVVEAGAALATPGPDLELVDLDGFDLGEARRFAEGRCAFLVRRADGTRSLACLPQMVSYEADLVRVQAKTGAEIVQRTALLGAVRLFTHGTVVSWDGSHWSQRPTAAAVLDAVLAGEPRVPPEVLLGALDLAVHWMSPAHVGATLVVRVPHGRAGGLDTATALTVPGLNVTDRRHFGALFSILSQSDLATIVGPDGTVEHVGVGLLSTAEAEAAVDVQRGMRHRSGQRFSFDEPDAVVVVVSEDGPVTVYVGGRPVAST